MNTIQAIVNGNPGLEMGGKAWPLERPLVPFYGIRYHLVRQRHHDKVRALFPANTGNRLLQQSLVLTAMAFKRARCIAQNFDVTCFELYGHAYRKAIIGYFVERGFKPILVSEGSFDNGSERKTGMEQLTNYLSVPLAWVKKIINLHKGGM